MMTSFLSLKACFSVCLWGIRRYRAAFPDPCFQVEPTSEISIYRYSGVAVFTAALGY